MDKKTQIILLIVSILMLLFVINRVSKNKVNIRYSVIWIVFCIFLILISIFPGIVNYLSKLIGIQVPSNMIFLFVIFFLLCLIFYLYIKISKHNDEIIKLDYEIAKLKKEVEDSKKK